MTEGSHDADAARMAIGISRVEEQQIARQLSPSVAWPTLILALLPATFGIIVALGLSETLPLWICAAILTPVSYAHYTLVHEAIHRNVVSRRRGFDYINTVVGWIGALGMGRWLAGPAAHPRPAPFPYQHRARSRHRGEGHLR
jgi:beta-carotene hydroxylase